jgi:secreted trypsin-like serine protease
MRHFVAIFLIIGCYDSCTTRKALRSDVIAATTKPNGNGNPNGATCGTQTIQPSIVGSNLNSGVSRIVSGQTATSNSWPWIVGIYLIQNSDAFYKCTGTLVSFRYVLTAASCISGLTPAQVQVSVGTDTIVGASSSSLIAVEAFIITNTFPLYDIALIQLSQIVDNSSTVNFICLPSSDNATVIFNQNVVVTGW